MKSTASLVNRQILHSKGFKTEMQPTHRDRMLSDGVPIGCITRRCPDLFPLFSSDAANWSWESPNCDELFHVKDPQLALGDGSGSTFMW